MRRTYAPLILTALLLASGFSLAAALPDVTYTTVTSFNFEGFLGRIMARQLPEATYEQAYLRGNVMLMKDEESNTGTLIDADEELYVAIDYGKKTYAPITFSELRALYEQKLEEMAQEREEAAEDDADVDVQFDVRVDRTGETGRIGGYEAERVLLTLLGTGTATDQESGEMGSGTLVIATESWMSRDVPGYDELQAFQATMQEKMGEAFAGAGGQDAALAGIAQALGSDPEAMQASLAKARAELQGLEGLAVQTTMHIVLVPDGVDYEASRVFSEETADAEQPKKKRRGFGGLRKALEEAAASAGGDGTPEQKTLFSLSSALENIEQAPVAPGLLEVPADFREVAFNL